MNNYAIDAGSADFQEKVLDASCRQPVLVDFWADWCAPCRILKPLLEKLAAEYQGRFLLAKVNSDQNQELASRYGVRGIPNVKAFVNGKLVDEFTGALPEAQIRGFIDSLMPSPAEPLRVAALEARARGEAEVACSLLEDALEMDPGNEAVQLDLAEIRIDLNQPDAAQALLDRHRGKDTQRAAALLARLKLVATGKGVDADALRVRIEADAGDLDARLQLAGALALARDYRAALEQLLEIVRRDRKWRDEAARRTALDLFTLLAGDPQQEELVREFRIRLARTLN